MFRQHLKQPFDEANDFCDQVEQRLANMASARASKQLEKRLEKSPSLARWEVAEAEEVRKSIRSCEPLLRTVLMSSFLMLLNGAIIRGRIV
jgi:CHASE3 domain sensor protein